MGSKSSSSQPQYFPTVQNTSQAQSGTSQSTQTQTTQPDPLARLAYEQVLSRANQIAQTPYQPYEGQMVAGFTPDTLAAFQGIRNMQGVQTPYLSQAGNLYEQSTNTWQNPYLPKAEGYYGQSFGYIPNQYMGQVGDYTSQAMKNAVNQQIPVAQNYFNQGIASAQNPDLTAARNYFGQAVGYTPNPQLATTQNLFNQSLGAAVNPLLNTAQNYGQLAAAASLSPSLGQAQDYLTKSLSYIQNPQMPQTQGLTNQAVNLSDIGNFNQQALSRYMNPFQQSVVDATLAQMKQNQDVLQNQNVANAIRQGAYGGSGQFMGQAELGRQQALANAQTLAGLNAQNYQQAMSQYNQQQKQAIEARQAAAQLLGGLGQQQAGLGVQALQNAAQTTGQLGQQQAGLSAGTLANLAQMMGQLGQSQAGLNVNALQQAAQTLGQLGQSQAALQAGTAAQVGQAQGQLGQAQANALSQAQQQAGQTLGQLGQSQAQLLAGTGMNVAQLYGDLGNQMAQRGIQAYQNAASQLGQLGQAQQALGVNALQGAAQGVAGLGKQAQQAALTDATALQSIGEQQRQLQQQQLTNAYNQWLQAQAYPYQQTSYFAGLAGGMGPLLGSTVDAQSQAASQGSSTGSGTGLSPYQQPQQGGGQIPGLITTGLGLLSKLFGVKNGGRVGHADGGEVEDESFAKAISKTPYAGGAESPTSSKIGLGSLMSSAPYTAPDDYIGEAAKLQKIIKPASQAGRERLLSKISETLDLIPEFRKFDPDLGGGSMKGYPKYPKYTGETSDGNWGDVAKSIGELAGSKDFKSGVSSGLGSLSSLFENFEAGGRVGYADGGAPAPVAEAPLETRIKQGWGALDPSAGLNKSYVPENTNAFVKKTFNVYGQPSDPATVENIAGRINAGEFSRPQFIDWATTTYGAPKNTWDAAMLYRSEPKTNYEKLLAAAYANDPGAQLTPEEQGMPSKPPREYYTTPLPNYQPFNMPSAPSGGATTTPSTTTGGATTTPSTTPGEAAKTPSKVPGFNLATSTAYADPQVFARSLWQNYLGRSPTDEETKNIVDALAGGASKEAIEGSFQSLPAASTVSYLNDIYRKTLNRKPTQDEYSMWYDALNKGATFDDVKNSILGSVRKYNTVVQGYYPEIADQRINPRTGLYNLKYVAPYYSQGAPYAPLQQKDGGRVKKAAGGQLSGKSLYDYLIDLGANEKEAAMLTGMAKTESNFNPYVMHDQNTGYGLWGHGKDRWADMQKYTGERKPGWQEQAQFALWELRNSPKVSLARQALNKADDARDVAIAGMHFERPRGYTSAAPWLGMNWRDRFSNVQNLMLGRDLGKGPELRIAEGEPNRESLMFKNVATPATSERPRGIIPRILAELAPVGSAEAAESAPPERKSMFAWPELRNPRMATLPEALGRPNWPNQEPGPLPVWKKEIQVGFGPLQGERPADERQRIEFPTQEATVPLPPRRPDNIVAEDRDVKPKQKYWGDWRDTEPFKSDPIGGFFDTLMGDKPQYDEPRKMQRSSREDEEENPLKSIGDLFSFANGGVARGGYALGGEPAEEEEGFDPLGSLGSAIESGLGGLGDTIGGLFGEGKNARSAEEAAIVASDRIPSKRSVSPLSEGLLAAGLGMLAAPTRNPWQAVGVGGLRGLQVYETASKQAREQEEAAAQQQAAAAYGQRLSGAPVAEDREETVAEPGGRGAVSTDSDLNSLMREMSRIASVPATTPQEIQQKNAALRNLQTRISVAEKVEEYKTGKTGTIGRDEFGNPLMGYTSGPNVGKTLAEVRKEQGQPSGAGETGAIDWSKTGDEFLSTLPPDIQDEVKGIAEGRLDIPKGPKAQGVWKAVTRYSPGFDMSVYGARKKMRDSYADQSGTKPGAQITAGNTAIGHAGELSDLILKLNNYDIDILNKPLNWVAERYGGEAAQTLNKYRSLVNKYVDEQMSFYKGRGGGGIEERREARELLDPNKGTKVLLDTLRGDQEAMGSKVSELEEAWNRTMGKGQSVPIENYDVISKHGKEGKALLEHNYRVASGEAKPVRTGRTKDGRRVTQYSDGYIKYGE